MYLFVFLILYLVRKMFAHYCTCVHFFSQITEGCKTISGKSRTSVRYQSFCCNASGHLENICRDDRSQKFSIG